MTTKWCVKNREWELCSYNEALEKAREMIAGGAESVTLEEYRAAELVDVDLDELTGAVIWEVYEQFAEDERLGHDAGGPELDRATKDSAAWLQLRAALEALLRDHLDLSDAAWQPTGRTILVKRDSTPPAILPTGELSRRPETPELDKMLAVREKSRVLTKFVHWLEESDMRICDRAEYGNGPDYTPQRQSYEQLFARFLDIDLDLVETERRALLDHQRALNEEIK